MGAPHDAVLLLAFGGPNSLDDVRPFLDNVLRGRPVPRARYEEVVAHYALFGGVSPLNRLTRLQAEGLQGLLSRQGPGLPVHVGMRHWTPSIRETLAAMAGDGRRRAVGLILAAHPSRPSREAYYDAVSEARRAVGPGTPEVDYAGPWFDHPLFIEALADRLRETMARLPEPRRAAAAIVYTGHSIPVAMSDASGYAASLARTAGLVSAALGIGAFTIAWQSRSGAPDERWLEPDIGEALADLARRGAIDAVVAPIGFVSDHVEVLYDLDVAARTAAENAGLGFHRAPTAGDHPAFLRMLAAVVRDTVKRPVS